MNKKNIPKKEQLIDLYSKGYSMKDIGEKLGMSAGKIFKYFHIYDIKARQWGSRSDVAKKKISITQKGNSYALGSIRSEETRNKMAEAKRIDGIGHKKNRNGYVYVYYPKHPKSSKDGYIFEHHLVIENSIGRYLEDNEVVHHKNRIKNDNRLENLQLMTQSEHIKLHNLERRKEKEMMTY